MSLPDNPEQFPAPSQTPDVLVVAGEHSGDAHAARLVEQLRAKEPTWHVCALGGEELQKAGAQVLFDLPAHSVVGLVEVLKNYGFFKRLFAETLRWVQEHQPRAVVFVDYPGFNLRLAKALFESGQARKAGGPTLLYYYISPQIWAWKAKRRFSMAQYLDALAVIFPFETDTYRDTELPVKFVGHPFVEPDYDLTLRYDPDGHVLLLPGSRRQPVERIFPAMARAFRLFHEKHPQEQAVVLYPGAVLKARIEALAAEAGLPREAFVMEHSSTPVEAKAVLTSSGTMSLQCALAGIPGAICYRAHPLTFAIGRRLVKIKHLGIANLLLANDPPYPELLQNEASPERLCAELEIVLQQPSRAQAAQEAARKLRDHLSTPASVSAADWLQELIEHGAR